MHHMVSFWSMMSSDHIEGDEANVIDVYENTNPITSPGAKVYIRCHPGALGMARIFIIKSIKPMPICL